MTDERPQPGPSARAINAVSCVPDVRQEPTSVPADAYRGSAAAPGALAAGETAAGA